MRGKKAKRRGAGKRPGRSSGSVAQLVEQGRRKLEQGNASEALNLLKAAQRAPAQIPGAVGDLDFLFFCAYTLRARQLEVEGMQRDAAHFRGRADALRPSWPPDSLAEEDLATYVSCLDLDGAFQTYRKLLAVRGGLASVERVLADRLVLSRRWEHAAQLAEMHPLRTDGQIVRHAVAAMDAGDWEQAAADLRAVPRNSPFAPWRLFCKAMACFGAEDDGAVQDAARQLGPGFALVPVIEALRSFSPANNDRHPNGNDRLRKLLGTSGGGSEQVAQDLIGAVKGRRLGELGPLVSALARDIYPEDPIQACETLLRILGLAARQGALPVHFVLKLARRLLPPESADRVCCKIELAAGQPSHGEWNLVPAARYLSILEGEFPDRRQQALARGRVLEFLARSGYFAGVCPECAGPQVRPQLRSLVERPSRSPEMMFADLMTASLQADPDNRRGYDFLFSIVRGKAFARKSLENVLALMASRFPEDPAPHLELAALYYSENNFRRAETFLEKARNRAPHDERVLDLYGIGRLRSAEAYRARRKYDRARREYESVEAMGRRRLQPILWVKRLALELLAAGDAAVPEVERRLEPLNPFAQLRALAVLLTDLEGLRRWIVPKAFSEISRLLECRSPWIERLSSKEAFDLLSPLEEELAPFFDGRDVTATLSPFWMRILRQAQGDDLVALFDILLDRGGSAVVREEIDRRLSGAGDGKRDPMLLFYRAAIRFVEGADRNSRRFREAVKAADPSQMERLRAAGARLSRFLHGPAQEALRSFNFDLLDELALFPSGETSDSEALPALDRTEELASLQELEALIDAMGLNKAPEPLLRVFAGQIRSDPRIRRELDRLANQFEEIADVLSPAVRILLFRSKRRTRRKKPW